MTKDKPINTTSDEPRPAPAAAPDGASSAARHDPRPDGSHRRRPDSRRGIDSRAARRAGRPACARGRAERVYATNVLFLTNSRSINGRVYSRGDVASIDPDHASRLIGLGHAVQVQPGTIVNPADLPPDPMHPRLPESGAPVVRVRVVSGGNHLAGTRHLPAVGTELDIPEPEAVRLAHAGRVAIAKPDALSKAGRRYAEMWPNNVVLMGAPNVVYGVC